MNDKKSVLYVGYNGFPIGWAQVERQKLIAQGLISCGCDVLVVSRTGIHGTEKKDIVSAEGVHEGIPYTYASGTPFKEKSFLKRNLLKCKGLWNEIKIVRKLKKENKLDVILITTNEYYNVVFYSLLSKFFKVQSVIDNVEHWTSINHKKGFIEKKDNYLYDNYSFKRVDKVIGISDFLVNIVKTKAPNKPVLKVPVIVDFNKYQPREGNGTDFFLYCGSTFYIDVVLFVLDAFEKADNKNYILYVVVASNAPAHTEILKERIINSPKKDHIKLIIDLQHKLLVDLYMISKALLIPLRNTPQDFARFPHKTGEYCASGKTILTTNFGEMTNYFKDEENALLAKDYDSSLFAEKMEFVVNNPSLAEELGNKSYQVGKENFDHIILGKKIYEFIFLN